MSEIEAGDVITIFPNARNYIGHRLCRTEVVRVREVESSVTPGWTLIYAEILTLAGRPRKNRPLRRFELAGNDYRIWE